MEQAYRTHLISEGLENPREELREDFPEAVKPLLEEGIEFDSLFIDYEAEELVLYRGESR